MVVISVRGPSSLAECEVCVAGLLADPSIPDGCTVLLDLTEARDVPPVHEIDGLAALIASVRAKQVSRMATVAVQVGHCSIAALVAAVASSRQLDCRMFLSRGSALLWLSTGASPP